jgi:NADH:ubiquinone oxidoreductase subunit C
MSEATAAAQDARDLGDLIADTVGDPVTGTEVVRGQLIVHVRRDDIVGVLTMLRDHGNFGFEQLMDVTAVDHPAATSASTWSTTCSACRRTSACA